MILRKGQVVKSILIKRSVMRNKTTIYSNNPMTNVVIGVITFGIIYDVMDTFRKHKEKRNVIEPIVIEEEENKDIYDYDYDSKDIDIEESEFMSKKQKTMTEFMKNSIQVRIDSKEEPIIDVAAEDKT